MPIRYQKYSAVADTAVCWLLQSYKQNPIQEGREGFECFPLSSVLQFMDVRKQISDLISFITFSRLLYSEANEKSQTKWPLQRVGTFTDITYICICTHRHVGQILQTLKAVFFPHYQRNGVCKAAQPATCASASADTTKPQLVCSHCRDCNGSSFCGSLWNTYSLEMAKLSLFLLDPQLPD